MAKTVKTVEVRLLLTIVSDAVDSVKIMGESATVIDSATGQMFKPTSGPTRPLPDELSAGELSGTVQALVDARYTDTKTDWGVT